MALKASNNHVKIKNSIDKETLQQEVASEVRHLHTSVEQLQLAVIAPHCTKLLAKCIQTSFQIRSSEAGMEYCCCKFIIQTPV